MADDLRSETVRSRRRRRRAAGAVALTLGTVGGLLVPGVAGAAEPSADLSVRVAHTPSSVQTGQDVTFQLTARNDGPDTAADVLVAMAFGYPLQSISYESGCRLSGSSPSIICSVGDLASGQEVTRTITLRPAAAGLYTFPVATSSETADPDTADRATTETLIVRPGQLIGERYVRGEFPTVFGRAADPAAVTSWGNRFQTLWQQDRRRLVEVPQAWLASAEYRRIRIREAYQRILGRPAGTTDVAYWSPRLGAGLPYDAFERRLIDSNEWTRRAGAGSSAQIVAVYQAILGRAPTSAEVNAVLARLGSGPWRGFGSFAGELQRTVEWRVRQTDAIFQRTFGAPANAVDRYGWAVEMARGATPEALWARLLVGFQVMGDYPPTEDDYSYWGGEGPVFDFSRAAPLG